MVGCPLAPRTRSHKHARTHARTCTLLLNASPRRSCALSVACSQPAARPAKCCTNSPPPLPTHRLCLSPPLCPPTPGGAALCRQPAGHALRGIQSSVRAASAVRRHRGPPRRPRRRRRAVPYLQHQQQQRGGEPRDDEPQLCRGGEQGQGDQPGHRRRGARGGGAGGRRPLPRAPRPRRLVASVAPLAGGSWHRAAGVVQGAKRQGRARAGARVCALGVRRRAAKGGQERERPAGGRHFSIRVRYGRGTRAC